MALTRKGARDGAAAVGAVLRGLCLAAAIVPASAQADRPRDQEIAAIQERGRLIARYLNAVEQAGYLLKAQGSGAPTADRTVVIPDREGWRVVYLSDPARNPALSATGRKGLAIVAETTFSPDAGEVGSLNLIVPPRTATSTIQSYARSLDAAESATLDRPDAGRPSLEAVVREADGSFIVYVISQRQDDNERPGTRGDGSVVFGRDFAVRVGAAGRQAPMVERLHDSVAFLSLQPRAPGTPILHEHDKGDLPAPTDVALVLRYPALAPLLVLTQRFMFRVDREGVVTWLGQNPSPKPDASPTPQGQTGAP